VAFETSFPYLESEGFSPASPASKRYNCIAWAAGCQEAWWWPDASLTSYWPENVPRIVALEAFFAAFALLGYERCDDGHLERGFEKVAFYALDGKPTHAARQLPDGLWTSKLGPNVDVNHTLHALEGPAYGQPVGFIKRRSNS
jgi:hypothetical protein